MYMHMSIQITDPLTNRLNSLFGWRELLAQFPIWLKSCSHRASGTVSSATTRECHGKARCWPRASVGIKPEVLLLCPLFPAVPLC